MDRVLSTNHSPGDDMTTVRKLMLASFASLMAAAAAYAADVSGTWKLSVESPRGVRESTLKLTQAGEELTGTLTGQRGDTPVKGTLKGKDLALSYTVDMQGNQMTVKYTGTVEGNTMNGTVAFGDMGGGKFTGTKQ
jgi:hypothetical protein